MKKTTLFLLLAVAFMFSAHEAFAMTESQCQTQGGDCAMACIPGMQKGTCEGSSKGNLCCQNTSNKVQVPSNMMTMEELKKIQAQQSGSGGMQSISFTNPLRWTTIGEVLGSLMGYLKGIAGTVAVIFIIIGGMMYMFSAGDKDMVERAKKTVTYAIIGLAIVVAAPTFLKEISTILGSDIGSNVGGLSLISIAGNVLRLLLSLVGFFAIISLIAGGIMMFGAAGDEKRLETAKNIVKYSILGIAIAVGSLVIAKQVVTLVSGY